MEALEKEAVKGVKYCKATQGAKVSTALTTEIAGKLWRGRSQPSGETVGAGAAPLFPRSWHT